MNHGPIDLIIEAFGDGAEIQKAYGAGVRRFSTVLEELCSELPQLRREASAINLRCGGSVARRMLAAVLPFSAHTFITPMAAVAGAVAEEILEAMTSAANLSRAYVNDGGDIALHLSLGEHFTAGMVDDSQTQQRRRIAQQFGAARIDFTDAARGIATSGWRGRSFSLGIADAVTVLTPRAAMADAAATIIANAVDLPGDAAIIRVPANEIAPDCDLGAIPVTRDVPRLNSHDKSTALANGSAVARELLHRGLICAAALHLQGETQIIGLTAALKSPRATNLALDRSLTHA